MKYTLNFSSKLERNGSFVVYNPELFTQKPVIISVLEVVEIFKHFIEKFDKVGITEQPETKSISSDNDKKTKNTSVAHLESTISEIVTVSTPLTSLSGEVYLCELKKLDENILNRFRGELTKYFRECCSNISPENLLSDEINLNISGLREAIELRNYLAKYTNSKKKEYQNGYLYIMG